MPRRFVLLLVFLGAMLCAVGARADVCATLGDGQPCDDGDACTQTDTCQGGQCVGGNPVVCTASDQCHVAGVCDPGTGLCSDPAADNDTPCIDNDLCTQTSSCQAGQCVGANPIACTASDQCHQAGTCDTGTGTCSYQPKGNGTPCNDGDACTQTDTCQSGTCVGTNPVVCAAPDQCHQAGTCDTGTGTCSYQPKGNGTPCNDGDACTQTDTCQSGTCVGTNPVVCTASDQCHDTGTCNTTTGVCSNPSKPDQTPCDDGKFCTDHDVCTAGVCRGPARDCSSAANQCNDAICNEQAHTCDAKPKNDGTTCSDGNACTQTDTCQSGSCVGTNPVVCATPDQCHNPGTCDTTTGVCSTPAKADQTPCDDGKFCTVNDVCTAGTCGGSARDCSAAANQCNDAVCNEQAQTCDAKPKTDGTTCSDGHACTKNDTCKAGSCVPGPAVVCTALDQCHDAGTCNDNTGVCSNPVKPTGMECDDRDACTTADVCRAGTCGGTKLAGCCNLDTECPDAFGCTEDRCADHACVHVPHDERCGAGDDCTKPSCAPQDAAAAASGCVTRPANETGYCSEDLDPCTSDVCHTGSCTHESDGSGPRCPALVDPFRLTLALLARSDDVRGLITDAVKTDCLTLGGSCTVVGGAKSPAPRLMALLDAVRGDLLAESLTLAGRLSQASTPDSTRDPLVRARLGLGLLGPTPNELRAFLASVAQARRQHLIGTDLARALRGEGTNLFKGTNKVRSRLRRLMTRRQSFAR
jgi:hypothetical protein